MKSNGDVILFVETKMECEIETLNEVKKKTIILMLPLKLFPLERIVTTNVHTLVVFNINKS